MVRALLVAAGADLFNPWYFGEIINHVLINRDKAAFLQSIIILSVVSLLSGKTSRPSILLSSGYILT